MELPWLSLRMGPPTQWMELGISGGAESPQIKNIKPWGVGGVCKVLEPTEPPTSKYASL